MLSESSGLKQLEKQQSNGKRAYYHKYSSHILVTVLWNFLLICSILRNLVLVSYCDLQHEVTICVSTVSVHHTLIRTLFFRLGFFNQQGHNFVSHWQVAWKADILGSAASWDWRIVDCI